VGRLDAEPPGQLTPVPRVVDTDPGSLEDIRGVRPEAVVDDIESRRFQQRPAQASIHLERLADQCRPRAAADAGPRLQGADQNRLRGALLASDEVQAVVHPVDEIHVGPARRPEHHTRSRGEASKGVRGAVLGSAVGLDLDQPPPAHHAAHLSNQQLAEQFPGHLQRVPLEEVGSQ
jgi:hypothetical protein